MSAAAIIPGVAVPSALVARPDAFGGLRWGDCLTGDLVVHDGRAVALRPGTAVKRMVLPKLTEVHCHLDKCHTIDRIEEAGSRVGGNLRHAIAAQEHDKRHWTGEDLRARMARGLAECAAAGCSVVRSHLDWSRPDPALPLAWEVLQDLASEHRLDLQLAALCGIDLLAEPGLANAMAGAIAPRRGVLGAFVLDQPHRLTGVRAAFSAADRHGLALDFHVDEGLDPDLDGLSVIGDVALETGFQGPVLCGHGCALSLLPDDDLSRLADRMARAGIALAALPSTNLYLQGRGADGKRPRGLAPVSALRERGVRVVIGTDNVRDAFMPLGRHDPLWALSLACLAAHLDPPMGQWLPAITTDARAALGLAPVTVDGARLAELVAFETKSTADLLAHPPPAEALNDLKMDMIA